MSFPTFSGPNKKNPEEKVPPHFQWSEKRKNPIIISINYKQFTGRT